MDPHPVNGLQYRHAHMKSAKEAQAEASAEPMSSFSLFMNGKRKREGDPIAFAIHFATGHEEPNGALLAVDCFSILAIWNSNCIACDHATARPLPRVIWRFVS